jgi:hypothetical protein
VVLLELAAVVDELAASPPAPPVPPPPVAPPLPELVVLSTFTSSEHAVKAPPSTRNSTGIIVE